MNYTMIQRYLRTKSIFLRWVGFHNLFCPQCNPRRIFCGKSSPLDLSTQFERGIPEHGSSLHGDREEDISFRRRIFVELFVVERSILSTLLQSIFARSNYLSLMFVDGLHSGEF
jgi:hypothetical protein